jgi:hypothetical protein
MIKVGRTRRRANGAPEQVMTEATRRSVTWPSIVRGPYFRAVKKATGSRATSHTIDAAGSVRAVGRPVGTAT